MRWQESDIRMSEMRWRKARVVGDVILHLRVGAKMGRGAAVLYDSCHKPRAYSIGGVTAVTGAVNIFRRCAARQWVTEALSLAHSPAPCGRGLGEGSRAGRRG